MRQWPESKNWVPTKNSLLKRRWFVFIWNRAAHFFYEEEQGRLDPAENSNQSCGSSMSLEDGKLGFKSAAEMIEKSWQTQSLLTILSRSVYMNSPGWEKGADFILVMIALQRDTLVQSYTLNPAGTSHLLLFHMETTSYHGSEQF